MQRATPDDFLSFLVDGPLGGLDRRARFAYRQAERDEQWHPGSVQSYVPCLPRPLTSDDYRPSVDQRTPGRGCPTGFPFLPRRLLGPCERDMELAAARSRMPSMASNHPRVAERSGPPTALHGEDTCEENNGRLATLAHYHRVPICPERNIAVSHPRGFGRPYRGTQAPRPGMPGHSESDRSSSGDRDFGYAATISNVDVSARPVVR